MLILHIGFNKSGSSTLQAFLHGNAERLAAQGVIYPIAGLGRRQAHHHLANHILAGEEPPEAATIARLAERSTVVLSSERFLQCQPERLRQLWGPMRVVCYRRDMLHGAVSRYAQSTKRGANESSFDQRLAADPGITFVASTAALPWARTFGAGAVRLRSLAEDCLVGGDLISDFCAVLGLGPSCFSPIARQNVRPGWRVLEILRAFSQGMGASRSDAAAAFVGRRLLRAGRHAELRSGLDDRGLYLSAGQIEQLGAAEAADLSAIRALGIDSITRPASPPPPRPWMPEAYRIPRNELTALLAQIRAHVLCQPARERPI